MREKSDHFYGAEGGQKALLLRAGVDASRRQRIQPSGTSATRKTFLILSITSLPLLTACVGSTVSTTLDTAALESPTQLQMAEDTYVSDFTTVNALPVPLRSPKSSELALTDDDAMPALNAVNAIAEGSEENAQAALAIEEDDVAGPETGENSGTPTQTAALSAAGATDDKAGVIVPAPSPAATVGTDTSTPSTRTATTATKQLAKKPVGFWGALFGGKPKKPNPAANTQVARVAPKTGVQNSLNNSGTGTSGGQTQFRAFRNWT